MSIIDRKSVLGVFPAIHGLQQNCSEQSYLEISLGHETCKLLKTQDTLAHIGRLIMNISFSKQLLKLNFSEVVQAAAGDQLI